MSEPDPILSYANPVDLPIAKRWVNWKRIALIVALFLLAFAIYYPFSPAAIQARNMRKAAGFVLPVQQRIAGDPRFDQVQVDVTTYGEGGLLLQGYVRSQTDLTALQAAANTFSLPVKTICSVRVLTPQEWTIYFDTSATPLMPASQPAR